MLDRQPKVRTCIICGDSFNAPNRGNPGKYCFEHRKVKYKNLRIEYSTPRNTMEPRDPGFILATQVTQLRLSVEQAKPLIRMALLRPDQAQDLLVTALRHLEDVYDLKE